MNALLFLLAASSALAAGRELFVDDHGIESTTLKRVVHAVTKHPGNPVLVPTLPWEGQYTLLYGTVLRDEEEGVWKMWYSTMNHFRYPNHLYPESTYLCYAVSRDGVAWRKPLLGLISYRGHRENNILFEAHHLPEKNISGILDAVSVLKDPRDPDPARRYKMMIWRQNHRLVDGKWILHREQPFPTGDYVAFSPDGLRWNELPDPVFRYDHVRDTMATMWDPVRELFVAFVKQPVNGKRARSISTSRDFVTWSEPERMLADDERDPPSIELYHNTGFFYEGMYLGLLTVIHPEPKDNIYLDIQLISSRDGRNWSRVGDRSPVIPVGRRDIDWDFGFNNPSSGPPVRVGDELWFYYSGRSYRHPVDGQGREPNKGAIGLAKLRLDGFVSMDAGAEGGTLLTRPVRAAGSALYVNADASRGSVEMEILDENGRPLPGYARGDCRAVRGAGVRQLALCKGAPLAGRTVRVRFFVRQASLYSYWFL